MLLPGCHRTRLCADLRRGPGHSDGDGHIYPYTCQDTNPVTKCDVDKYVVSDAEPESRGVRVADSICSANADAHGFRRAD